MLTTEFVLHICCDNSAFDGDPTIELERILAELSETVGRGCDPKFQRWVLQDSNGNFVGEALLATKKTSHTRGESQ